MTGILYGKLIDRFGFNVSANLARTLFLTFYLGCGFENGYPFAPYVSGSNSCFATNVTFCVFAVVILVVAVYVKCFVNVGCVIICYENRVFVNDCCCYKMRIEYAYYCVNCYCILGNIYVNVCVKLSKVKSCQRILDTCDYYCCFRCYWCCCSHRVIASNFKVLGFCSLTSRAKCSAFRS